MMDNDIAIRRAAAGDASALEPLVAELGYSPEETGTRLGRLLRSEGHRVLVAEATDGRLVGWVHVFGTERVESDPFAELGGLVVSGDSRSRGIGTALVRAAAAWASDNGYRKLRIRSRVERTDAHRLFERLGFIGHKTQRIFDRPLDGGPE